MAVPDFMKILQQAQEVKAKMDQLQEELKQRTVTGSAGGGMVTVDADGKGDIRRVKIDPSIVKPDDVEMLEDLIVVAVSDAQKRAAEVAKEEMSKLAGPLPFKLPF